MGFVSWLDRKFKVTESGSTVGREIVAGLIIFAVTIYSLPTNAGMFSAVGLTSQGAMYMAAGIGAFLGTLIMAFKNIPIAQLPGMGLNAYVIYTLCLTMGLSYANAIFLVIVEGVIFYILSKTGIRKKLYHAIPAPVLKSISLALGAFLFIIGLSGGGIITTDPAMSTGWTMVSFNVVDGNASWATIMPRLVFLFTLISIIVLAEGKKNPDGTWERKPFKVAVLLCMISGTIAYYLLGLTVPGFYAQLATTEIITPKAAFIAWTQECLFIGLREGWDFSAYILAHGLLSCIILVVGNLIGLCLCDMQDTNGTAIGCATAAGLVKVDENGDPTWDKLEDVMKADSAGTFVGGLVGASPITSYAECASAFVYGARTGLASLTAALCYLVALFITPVALMIPAAVYSAPLAYIGWVLVKGEMNRDLGWHKDLPAALAGVFTVLMMPITYNISYGIAWGLFMFVVPMIIQKRWREVKAMTYGLTAIFILMFFVTH